MILDKTNEFSDGQVVTATAISTNVIDLNPSASNLEQDIGAGEPVWLVVQVDQTATAAGAATVAVSLESSAAPGLTSARTHITTGALALGALTAGSEIARFRLPGGDYLRYLGVRYTVATGPLTAGSFSAFIVKDAQANKAYASGYQVL
ncbi:Bbp16 family capsid cement protein [Orrella dioscoreae]|uniref:Phage protein n=1 Tax=Orrella dioscoreae TaxID=1851544 RepID=A0A1C3K1D9_9BURK|nr:hypothetical protein [Orrella dioscoreae]SBT25330.1 Phage protein [Orrella dioscoreae]SOE49124.1 Phage protein [Orrella dioscoreae]